MLNKSDRTRGHNLKLNILRSKYDIRKCSSAVRVPKIWNSLS